MYKWNIYIVFLHFVYQQIWWFDDNQGNFQVLIYLCDVESKVNSINQSQ